MDKSSAVSSARLGATVIVIIVIGVYEGHGNSLLIPFLGGIGPKRRLDLPVLRSKVDDAEAATGQSLAAARSDPAPLLPAPSLTKNAL